MQRKKYFNFITDNKTFSKPVGSIIEMTEKLERELPDIAIVKVFPIRTVYFPDDIISYRRMVIVERRQGHNWDEIFTVINSIQVVAYKNIKII